MAAFSSSRYLLVFLLLNLHVKGMDADPNLTFHFKNFGKASNFESQLALFGDAMVGGDNISIQIGVSTTGRFVCKKPLNLVHEKSRQLVSFSNYFAFSMSGVNGDGLAFVMLPSQFPMNVFDGGEMGFLKERKMKFLAVEFDTFKNEKHGDVNDNHVGIDVGSPVSVKVSNVSSFNLVLNGGEMLQAWIDYEASSKRFEVRLNKFGLSRPLDPLLTYSIDLSKMWGDENVVVGFSSSRANSSQRNNIHSWSIESRIMPRWMHSEPLDPQQSVGKEEERKVNRRSDCTMRIVSALAFGTGCGALGAMLVLILWTVLGDMRPIVPEELVAQSKESECKKFGVSVDKTVENGKVLGA
ncbi:hypothetical protein SASPL_108728 [Salvia splendens]|uniref:Legume lectin domain-containing protein n=1 Tax=Salvia splendens TaxID=180675 RepID=A0A8X8YDL0_SALSN|nr:L-type lectin-domain containing receptor kinase VIII.2-like [Salvia splendens]KAG6430656.1 hypothetical protein SASPL_108728 [Salvia splendens]